MALFDEPAFAVALSSLPSWSGDPGRIARTVHASAPRAEAIRVEVMTVAEALDHHPLVEQHGDQLTFILWTHSAGGVTAKDIELAQRIDEILTQHEQAAPEA